MIFFNTQKLLSKIIRGPRSSGDNSLHNHEWIGGTSYVIAKEGGGRPSSNDDMEVDEVDDNMATTADLEARVQSLLISALGDDGVNQNNALLRKMLDPCLK